MISKKLIGKLIKLSFQVQGYQPAMANNQEFMDDRYIAQKDSANKMHIPEIPNIDIPNPGMPIHTPKPIYHKFNPNESNSTKSTNSTRSTPTLSKML